MNVLNQALITAQNKQQPNCKNFNIENNTSTTDKTKIDKKKLACSVGAAIGLTAMVVGGLAIKKKIDTQRIKQLTPNIEFKQCDTLDDAIRFGKEVLGIKKYKGFEESDLGVVNWINEGLSNVYNFTNGKATMPRKIVYENLDAGVGGTMNSLKTLTISKTEITSTQNLIKELINKIQTKENAEQFIKQLEDQKNYKAWKNTYINLIKKIPNIQKEIAAEVHQSTFSTIYHEMGHLQHLAKNKKDLVTLKEQGITTFKNCTNIAETVSKYATTSPTEFVAECFSKMCDEKQYGKTLLSDEARELYKKLGGYEL